MSNFYLFGNCSNKKRKQTQVSNTNQVSNSKKDLFLFGKESLQDSIIILSDNESESNNKGDEIQPTRIHQSNQETKSRKRFLDLSIDDEQISLCDSNETVNEKKNATEKSLRKKRKMGITALSENNFTCATMSDTRDLEITTLDLDDENIGKRQVYYKMIILLQIYYCDLIFHSSSIVKFCESSIR